MSFLRNMSPVRAYRDLRVFLASRERYELGFLFAAMLVTSFFIYAFAKDSYFEPAYKPNIIYVEQWPATRTDAEIRAQQKIDAVTKAKRLAEQKAREDEVRAGFKKMDDRMTSWGL